MRDELISRAAVMRALTGEYNRRRMREGLHPGEGLKLAWIEKAVNTVQGWIPVTERLPEPEVLVLVTTKTTKGVRNVNRAYYMNGFWHGSGSMAGVTAWMPLPEPYREEDEA